MQNISATTVLNAYDHRNRRIRKIVQRLHSTSAPPPAPPSGTDEWLTVPFYDRLTLLEVK